MERAFDRIKLLINEHQFNKISQSTIMVVGCGGVGAMCAESLARFGVNNIILMDHDVVNITNLNRQIHATVNNINQKKVNALKDRILAISPQCHVITLDTFLNEESIKLLENFSIDVIVDAIDTVTSKLLLIKYAQQHSIAIVSSMGMGNRIDPTKVTIMPLNKTSYDPLAKVMRYQCRKQGLNDKLMVVTSLEVPKKQTKRISDSPILKEAMPPSSSSFVPMAAGLACGYQAIMLALERV